MGLKSFIDSGQAHAKLSGTIIKIKGKPAYVFNVDRENKVHWCRLPDKADVESGAAEFDDNDERIVRPGKGQRSNKFNSETMDLSPLPLGYVNLNRPFQKGAYVVGVHRIPVRNARVGIHSGNVLFSNKEGRWNLFFTKNMEDTMMGRYPSLMDALDRAGKTGMCAFSRNFAVSNSKLYHVYYEEPVGSHMGGRLSLDPDFRYLGELLAEDL